MYKSKSSSIGITGLVLSLAISLVLAASAFAAETAKPAKSDSGQAAIEKATVGKLVVTYFHGNARCVTCRKLEAYAQEVMDSSYASSMKDSTVVWRLINFDEEENDHFLKDYKMYNQSLILSYLVDGKEKSWKNLDQIWLLVGDKEKYQTYIRDEITTFIAEQKK